MRRQFFYKTVMCDKWERTGACPYNEKCQFAHGPAELRVPSLPMAPRSGPTGAAPHVYIVCIVR